MGSVGVVLFPSKHKPYRLYCPVNRIFSHSYSFTYRVHFLQEQDTSLSLCKLLSDCYRCVITEHISDKRFSLSSASWSYIRDSRLFDTCNIPCLYCKKQHHELFSLSFFLLLYIFVETVIFAIQNRSKAALIPSAGFLLLTFSTYTNLFLNTLTFNLVLIEIAKLLGFLILAAPLTVFVLRRGHKGS